MRAFSGISIDRASTKPATRSCCVCSRPEGGGYEDWYLISGWGELNPAAVDARRVEPHGSRTRAITPRLPAETDQWRRYARGRKVALSRRAFARASQIAEHSLNRSLGKSSAADALARGSLRSRPVQKRSRRRRTRARATSDRHSSLARRPAPYTPFSGYSGRQATATGSPGRKPLNCDESSR